MATFPSFNAKDREERKIALAIFLAYCTIKEWYLSDNKKRSQKLIKMKVSYILLVLQPTRRGSLIFFFH